MYGDMLMLIYGREILTRKPGATFISEVKCSQILYDELNRLGGNAIMWKTGHSLIKAKMKEEHAELAGEMSGHMFFADRYYGFDDALYAACRLHRDRCRPRAIRCLHNWTACLKWWPPPKSAWTARTRLSSMWSAGWLRRFVTGIRFRRWTACG